MTRGGHPQRHANATWPSAAPRTRCCTSRPSRREAGTIPSRWTTWTPRAPARRTSCKLAPSGPRPLHRRPVRGGRRAGGHAASLTRLGLLDGSAITCFGRRWHERVKHCTQPAGRRGGAARIDNPFSTGRRLARAPRQPRSRRRHREEVAPSTRPCSTHTGPARVFDSEEAACEAIYAGEIEPGDVVVIRYEGPKGGPGMREMLTPTSVHRGRGACPPAWRSSPTAASRARRRARPWGT